MVYRALFLLLFLPLIFFQKSGFAQIIFEGSTSLSGFYSWSDQVNAVQPSLFLIPSLHYHSSNFQIRSDLRVRYFPNSESELVSFELNRFEFRYFFSGSDLVVGLQQPLFGISEMGPVDLFTAPLDLRVFFTQPPDFLRLGIWAASYRFYAQSGTFETILALGPLSHHMPEPGENWFPTFPFSDPDVIQLTSTASEDKRTVNSGIQWTGQLTGSLKYALYLFYWNNPQPVYYKQIFSTDFISLTKLFPQSPSGGFSLDWAANSTITLDMELLLRTSAEFDIIPVTLRYFNPETASSAEISRLLQDINDFNKTGFLTNSPLSQLSVGISYQSGPTIVKLQHDLDIITNYSSEMLKEPVFHRLSLFYSGSFFRELVTPRLTAVFHPQGKDIWLNPEISYDWFDGAALTVFVHYFDGTTPPDWYGHQHLATWKRNSHIGIRFTYFW